MRAWKWIGAAWASLCSAAAAPPPPSITYEAGACYGFCPVYQLTIHPDGNGVIEGKAHIAAMGRHRFKASAAQFQAFARELAPLRPGSGSVRYDPNSRCGPSITDMPWVRVTWRSGGSMQSLYFYYGCDPRRFTAIAERLRRAPTLLPIAALIRPAPLPRRR
jgi:hypothetical protein